MNHDWLQTKMARQWLSLLILAISTTSLFSSTLLLRRSNLATNYLARTRESSQDEELSSAESVEKSRECDLGDVLCQTLVTGEVYLQTPRHIWTECTFICMPVLHTISRRIEILCRCDRYSGPKTLYKKTVHRQESRGCDYLRKVLKAQSPVNLSLPLPLACYWLLQRSNHLTIFFSLPYGPCENTVFLNVVIHSRLHSLHIYCLVQEKLHTYRTLLTGFTNRYVC